MVVFILVIIWGILFGLFFVFYSLYLKELLEKWFFFVIVGWGMIIGGIGVMIVYFIFINEFILLLIMKYVKLSILLFIIFVVIFGIFIVFYLYLDSI